MSRDRSITLENVLTSTEGTVIEVSLSYDEGGPNYFHGNMNPRGFNLHATVWTIRDGVRSTILGTGGLKRQVEEAKRYNAKRLAALAEAARNPESPVGVSRRELVDRVMQKAGLQYAGALTQIAHEVPA
jgi:hypothetical protein